MLISDVLKAEVGLFFRKTRPLFFLFSLIIFAEAVAVVLVGTLQRSV